MTEHSIKHYRGRLAVLNNEIKECNTAEEIEYKKKNIRFVESELKLLTKNNKFGITGLVSTKGQQII